MGASVYFRLHAPRCLASGPSNGRKSWSVCNA
jgi:hypothetical protein